jgi:hypothetical protein
MNPFRMRQRNSSLMMTGFGHQRGLTPGSLMKHDFKDAWNEVSDWHRKGRAARRSEIFTGVWGMASVLRTILQATLSSSFDQNLAGNLVNPARSTFQQIQAEP